MNSNRKILLTLLIAAGLIAGVWLAVNYKNGTLKLLSIDSIDDQLTQIKRAVLTPPPLRSDRQADNSFLTVSGAVIVTNEFRVQAGLPRFQVDPLLETAAAAKLNDMFNGQYFAHVSPTDRGAADFVTDAGYRYVVIGENLALGNFETDQELVQAWMDSPGHRENILHDNFTEIGVAVGQGTFEGQETWLAVQIFGKPVSACPAIDEALRADIDNSTKELQDLEREIKQVQAQLETERPGDGASKDEVKAYNELVKKYNGLAGNYNELARRIKEHVRTYNEQIDAFNKCAQET